MTRAEQVAAEQIDHFPADERVVSHMLLSARPKSDSLNACLPLAVVFVECRRTLAPSPAACWLR